MTEPNRPVRVMVALTVAVGACALLPPGQGADLAYQAVGLLAVVAASWPLLRRGPARPAGWLLVMGGYLGWLMTDPVHSSGIHVLDPVAQAGAGGALRLAA